MLIKESKLRQIIRNIILESKFDGLPLGGKNLRSITEREKNIILFELEELCRVVDTFSGAKREKAKNEIQRRVDMLMTLKDSSGQKMSFEEIRFLTLKSLNPSAYSEFNDFEDYEINKPMPYERVIYNDKEIDHLMIDRISPNSPYRGQEDIAMPDEYYDEQDSVKDRNPFYIEDRLAGHKVGMPADNDPYLEEPEEFDIDDSKHGYSSWFKKLYKKYAGDEKDSKEISFKRKNKK
tara:strand:- start:26 stop:733 length:708 start_codon:yes stop_codon:yes gene_type:complete